MICTAEKAYPNETDDPGTDDSTMPETQSSKAALLFYDILLYTL